MSKFEAGKTYQTRSICDHDCIFSIEVISRTEKMLTYKDNGRRVRRSKIHSDGESEWIRPDNYSMSAVYRASREAA